MLEVVIVHGHERQRRPWPVREVCLGSHPECDWVLPYPGVSRRHATVHPVDGHLVLRDLGSRNGLVIGGSRHEEVTLGPGRDLHLGGAVLRIERVESSDGTLGLALATEADSNDLPGPRKDKAETDALAEGPEARALTLVRELATGSEPTAARRPGFVRAAREALGAQSLFRGRKPSDDEIALTDLAGSAPSIRLLEEVESALARLTSRLVTDEGIALISPPKPGTRSFLVAHFVPAPREVEPWKEMFLAFLAEHLRDEASAELEPEEAYVEPGDPLRYPREMVVGGSRAFQTMLAQLRATAPSRANVLLYGETGTGKELVARLIHLSGPTPEGPFVAVNCAAIPSDLFESEFFGIDAGVATGVKAREGLLQQSHGGTLLLDEVGALPLAQQAKLLRVLQEREVAQVGARKLRRVDARIVAAANHDLEPMVASGAFRADLFYRLSGLSLRLPALRERLEDVPEIVLSFARRASRRYAKRIAGVSHRALALLLAHDWPGNVRELANVVDRAVLLCPPGGMVRAEHLELRRSAWATPGTTEPSVEAEPPAPPAEPTEPAANPALSDWRLEAERRAVDSALAATGGQRTAAARLLGITRQGLLKKLKRLGLT